MIYSPSSFAETFTRAHLDYLKPHFTLTGSPWPDKLNGNSILPGKFSRKILAYSRSKQQGMLPLIFHHGLVKTLKRHRPDIIFAEFGDAAATLLPYCKQLNIPLAAGFYGYDAFETGLLNKLSKQYLALFGYASFIMTQSNSIREALINMGAPAEKIFVNTCPPANDFKDIARKDNGNTLTFVGRFVEKKSPQALLLVLNELRNEFKELRLIMAGDGPLLSACKQLCSLLQLNDRVTFTGRIDRTQQLQIFEETTLMLQHSITASSGDCEGIPVVLMEAGMAGIPVVSTLHSGIPEVVLQDKTGILVPEGEIHAMAAAVRKLLQEPVLRHTLGDNARDYLTGKYSMEKHISVLYALLAKSVVEK
jgi:glycosyltransferase involved in cell wall biosynthesis